MPNSTTTNNDNYLEGLADHHRCAWCNRTVTTDEAVEAFNGELVCSEYCANEFEAYNG